VSLRYVALLSVALVCLTAFGIVWLLTGPVLDEQTRRRANAERLNEWQKDELARMAKETKLLAWQVRSAGLRPVTEIKPGEDVPAADVAPTSPPEVQQ
jgi:hypothetical protein